MPNLFANLITGAGSIIELIPAEKRRVQATHRVRTVNESIASDWVRVGQHLQRAMKKSSGEMSTDGKKH